MPENLFIPSVDLRVGALEEYNRIRKEKAALRHKKEKPRPCITLSRQYGCEGYPVAEHLVKLLEQKSSEPWLLIDRDVLDEVARHHNISRDILESLGEKNRLLDDILAAFSSRWTHSQECFQLLCRYVVSLAEQGNVVIMELGGAIITRHFEHAWHYRIYASEPFKIRKISERTGMRFTDAEQLISKEQRKRDNFTKEFLDSDDHDPLLYDMLFNNDRMGPQEIAEHIFNHLMVKLKC